MCYTCNSVCSLTACKTLSYIFLKSGENWLFHDCKCNKRSSLGVPQSLGTMLERLGTIFRGHSSRLLLFRCLRRTVRRDVPICRTSGETCGTQNRPHVGTMRPVAKNCTRDACGPMLLSDASDIRCYHERDDGH